MKPIPENLLQDLPHRYPDYVFRVERISEGQNSFTVYIFGVPVAVHREVMHDVIMLESEFGYCLTPITQTFEQTLEYSPEIAPEVIARMSVKRTQLTKYINTPYDNGGRDDENVETELAMAMVMAA